MTIVEKIEELVEREIRVPRPSSHGDDWLIDDQYAEVEIFFSLMPAIPARIAGTIQQYGRRFNWEGDLVDVCNVVTGRCATLIYQIVGV